MEQQKGDQILLGEGGRRTVPVFRMGAEEMAATTQESQGSGNEYPHGLMGVMPKAMDALPAMGGDHSRKRGQSSFSIASSLNHSVQFSVQYTPSAPLQMEVAAVTA